MPTRNDIFWQGKSPCFQGLCLSVLLWHWLLEIKSSTRIEWIVGNGKCEQGSQNVVVLARFYHLVFLFFLLNSLFMKNLNPHGVVICCKVQFQLLISCDIYVHVGVRDCTKVLALTMPSLGGLAASHWLRLDHSEMWQFGRWSAGFEQLLLWIAEANVPFRFMRDPSCTSQASWIQSSQSLY